MSAEKYRAASFLTSAAQYSQLPADRGMEVAFAGCSNAGKSSTLNALTRNKGLARTSKTPGRTQLINLFALEGERRLVDLPGFGYAKVPPKMKELWQKNIDQYLRDRTCLCGIVLVTDIRHPLKSFECDMMAWSVIAGVPMLVVLNKMDKLSKQASLITAQKVQAHSDAVGGNITVLPFSAMRNLGVDDMVKVLDGWFGW